MSYELQFNSTAKTISISSQTACEWSCVVMRGNVTLSKYYGVLGQSGSTSIRVFTYGTTNMFGDVICLFKENGCVKKEFLTLESNHLPFFYLTNNEILLFGKETRSYIYVYYGTPLMNDEYGLVPLIFKINDEVKSTFTYFGAATYSTVRYMDEDLYDIILNEYNSLLGCVEICIVSKTNLMFNDAIIVSVDQSNSTYNFDVNEAIISIKQNVIENLPTLLSISPSLIFLSSTNPQQKINVTSLYQGERAPYYISSSPPNTSSAQTIAYGSEIERYLNSENYSIEMYKNDDLNVLQLVSERNASHFILNMSGKAEHDENIDEEIGYKLYVVNSADTSCYQELEIFYDYIRDPFNFIEISAITGAYAYVGYDKNNKVIVYEINESTKTIIFDSHPILSAQTSLTLFFTKTQWDLSDKNLNEYLDYVFVDYNAVKNVVFTIKSEPEWWKILTQSEYVKEVKKENQLIVSLEDEIPNNENTYVTLQNKLGSTCTIYVKNEENIFANKNEYIFGLKGENDEYYNNIVVTFSAKTENVIYIRSHSLKPEIYYVTQEKRVFSNSKFITLKTIKYETLSGTSQSLVNIVTENFEILYNQNINKYYINYSNIVMNAKGEKEKKDIITYYFNDNGKEVINVSVPIRQNKVPWNLVNNGSGVLFNLYEKKGNKYVLLNNNIPTYLPNSDALVINDTTIHIVNSLPSNGIEGDLYLTPNNLITDIQDTSTIIFQQLNSYKEVYLTINFLSTDNDEYVNKYGNVPTINKMVNLPFNTKIDCLKSDDYNIITLNGVKNDSVALYYTSYSKVNKFITENNENVNFYIIKNYLLSPQTIDFSKTYASDSGNTVLYSGTTNTYFNETSIINNSFDTFLTQSVIINDWELKEGFLTINNNGIKQKHFPNTPIYNIIKNNEDYVFFYDNIVDYNTKPYVYFIINFEKQERVDINGNLKKIENYNNGFLSYIENESFYEIIFKSINFNGQLIKLEKGNIFNSPIDGGQYTCYQDKKGNYLVNIPSMKFVLSKNQNSIQIQNSIITEKNLSYTYNNITYYPHLKVNLRKNIIVNILQSVGGSIIEISNVAYDEKEYFIIINNKKYSYNALKNQLLITPFCQCELNDTKKIGEIKDNDFVFDLINEPYKKYVIINNEEYDLIDNKITYDSNEYGVTTFQNDSNKIEVIIIGHLGYKVKEKNNKYYCIINNEKYYYNNNTLKIKNITTASTPNYYFKVTEKINEKFNYTLNLNDLLSSNFITATNSGNTIITNGFVEDGEKQYPVQKFINIIEKEDNTHDIISEEYVDIPFTNDDEGINSYSSFTLTFLDETLIISDKLNSISALTSSGIQQLINETNNSHLFTTNDSIKCILTEDITITVNDYSAIRFQEKCVIQFKNDCIIRYKIANEIKNYQFRKNELLYISQENCEIIFTDVVTLTFIKYKGDEEMPQDGAEGGAPMGEDPMGGGAEGGMPQDGYFRLNVFDNIVIDDENEIYFPTIINGQESILYNKNIFYIFNGKVEIINKNSGEEQELEVFERYVFIKKINENGISVIYRNEVENIYQDNEKTYGYLSGDTIVVLSLNDKTYINWSIHLPVYNIDTNKLELQQYIITDLNIYKFQENVLYQFGQIKNYSNIKGSLLRNPSHFSIDIENGHFMVKVDCYEVNVYDANNILYDTYYTNENEGYKFTMKTDNTCQFSNLSYSMWDYYANTYIYQTPLYYYNGERELDVTKEITINNITLTVDEKKYIQIDNDEYLEIHSTEWKSIDTSNKTINLYYWDIDNEIRLSKDFTISSTTIYEKMIGDDGKEMTFTNIERFFVKDYALFSSSALTSNTSVIETEITYGSNIVSVEIENKYFYRNVTNISNVSEVNNALETLRRLVESEFYQKYTVTLKNENDKEIMVLTPHKNVFLNDNKEIQVASTYNIYDDNNEKYEFYCFYKGNIYNINYGILTLPNQKYEIVKNVNANENNAYVLYDINSCLTHNLNVLKSNEIYGYAKKILFENKIEKEHTEYIMIEINIEKNECDVIFQNNIYVTNFSGVTYSGETFNSLLENINEELKITENGVKKELYDIKFDKTKNKIYINLNKYGKCRLNLK